MLEAIDKLTTAKLDSIMERYNLTTILLFGSASRGDFNEASDMDIAVIGKQPLELDDKLKLELYFEDIADKEIDLIDLNDEYLDIFVKIQALNDGKVIYSTDNNQLLDKCIDDTEHYYRINESFYARRRRDLLS